jgi:hypothetical protein
MIGLHAAIANNNGESSRQGVPLHVDQYVQLGLHSFNHAVTAPFYEDGCAARDQHTSSPRHITSLRATLPPPSPWWQLIRAQPRQTWRYALMVDVQAPTSPLSIS